MASVTYQGRRDLGPQPPREHVTPVAPLWKEEEESAETLWVSQHLFTGASPVRS